MGCNINIEKIKSNGESSLLSEREFDLWLFRNRVTLKEQISAPKTNGATLLINTNPVETRKAAWESFRGSMQIIHDAVRGRTELPQAYGDKFGKLVTVGTTALFGKVGNADNIMDPVNDFGEFDWSKYREELRAKKFTDAQIAVEIEKKKKLQILKKIDGNIFGAIVQDHLLGTTENLDALRSHDRFNENLNLVGITFDEAVARIRSFAEAEAKKIKAEIVRRHGSDIKIFTEVEVFSREISPEMKVAMSKASLALKMKNNANVVRGYLDVVIQDSNGQLHTYDIKLSGHSITDWWGGNGSNWKYDEISAQQMAYATMARQWGIEFNTVGIIPAHIVYDEDGSIKSVAQEAFKEFSLTNKYAIACERYFPVHRKTDTETIKQLSKLTEELYPGLQLSTTVKAMEMSKDYVMQNMVGAKKSDGKYHLHLDYEDSLIGKEFIAESKEEMERFVVETYIPKINERYSQELRGLAKSIRTIASSKIGEASKTEQLYEMARGFSKNKDTQDWIVSKFKKFVVQGGWDLVSDDENLLADYGIFVFVRNGLAEVIMLDNSDLYGLVELGRTKNTTVLGNLKHDLSEGMDDLNIMKSLRGNLLLMKAMAFISQNTGTLFNNIKIQAVRAMNLRWCQEIDEANDKLVNNWDTLAGFYNLAHASDPSATMLRTIKTREAKDNPFLSSGLAYVQRANDIVETFLDAQIHFKEHADALSRFTDDTAEDILKYMKNLKASSKVRVENSANWTTYSEELEAYQFLARAYMAVRGFIISAQNGIGDYVSGGIFATGSRTSSPAESNSPALRLFNQIDSTYEQKLRDEFMKVVQPWQVQMLKVYEENGIDKVFGGDERKLFKYCFETDKDGNITSDFCLIPPDAPDHPYFKDGKHPELKKLVKMFLEQINEIRIPDEAERLALSMKRGSIYYQVPLTETSFRHKAAQGGLTSALKAEAQSIFDEMKNFMYGKPLSNFEIKQFKSIDREQVYDPYLSTSEESQEFRRKQLTEQEIEETDESGKTNKRVYKVSNFETSLDTIFLKAMASALRARVSQEFMPLFTGLRCILAYNDNVQGAELESVRKAVDDFIKSAVFGKKLIPPEFQKIDAIIRILKKVTSTVVLAGSSVAFTREMITSTLRTSFNKAFDPIMKGQFTENEYLNSIADIILNSHENVDVLSFYSQMNFAYGLANVSQEQMDRAAKTGFLNPHNWEEDLLFMTSTSPDFVHRNAILCAILKHRGSYEAYSLNEDKELVYDMSKDKYYEIFWKYKDDYDKITDRKTKELYKLQEGHYLNALEDWNRKYGLDLKYGDLLPHSLSPTEANGIKVYADHMFGNYDASTKSLIQKGMLGSIMFQFKTYSINRFLQIFRNKGTINVTRQHVMQTDDGDEVWEIPSLTAEEIAKYGARRLVKKSEISEEDLNRANPVIQFGGTGTAGTLVIDLEILRDAVLDRDRFMENWKNNKVYRAQLYLSLIDNLGMLFIAMLLKLLYGEETTKDLYNQDWWTRWTYTVLMGVAQDGPIDQVVGGLVGDGTPPAFSILKSFYTNAYRVITGEDTAMFGFMNSFGATRQFAGMFNNTR